MLSEISQSETNIVESYIRNLKKKNKKLELIKTEIRMMIARDSVGRAMEVLVKGYRLPVIR